MFFKTLRHIVKSPKPLGFGTSLCPSLLRFTTGQSHWGNIETSVSKPLRILFCGSDQFSAASLRALHAEQQRDPAGIPSIDVLVRPGKRAGRGLKIVREAPLKAVAVELGLRVHERDTFTGWDLPKPYGDSINLIVAVSFGLFVPPRILRSAEYGGINLHPSILPGFRGSAPIEHQILKAHPYSGVSLQTLDEKAFDHGLILYQTSTQEARAIDCSHMTYSQLWSILTPKAADVLVLGIQKRLFVPPLVERCWNTNEEVQPTAPKITMADKEVNFASERADGVVRKANALGGKLWSTLCVDPKKPKRAVFEDLSCTESIPGELVRFRKVVDGARAKQYIPHGWPFIEEMRSFIEGKIRFLPYTASHGSIEVAPYVVDGDDIIIYAAPTPSSKIESNTETAPTCVRVKYITIEGAPRKTAAQAVTKLKEQEHWRLGTEPEPQTWLTISACDEAGETDQAVAKWRAVEFERWEAVGSEAAAERGEGEGEVDWWERVEKRRAVAAPVRARREIRERETGGGDGGEDGHGEVAKITFYHSGPVHKPDTRAKLATGGEGGIEPGKGIEPRVPKWQAKQDRIEAARTRAAAIQAQSRITLGEGRSVVWRKVGTSVGEASKAEKDV